MMKGFKINLMMKMIYMEIIKIVMMRIEINMGKKNMMMKIIEMIMRKNKNNIHKIREIEIAMRIMNKMKIILMMMIIQKKN